MPDFRKALIIAMLGAVLLPSTGAATTPLTREQIANKIIGKTLNARRMGMPVKTLYKQDGTVTIKFAIMSSVLSANI